MSNFQILKVNGRNIRILHFNQNVAFPKIIYNFPTSIMQFNCCQFALLVQCHEQPMGVKIKVPLKLLYVMILNLSKTIEKMTHI